MVNWQCICAIVLWLLGWGEEDLTITRLAQGSSLKLALDKLLKKNYLPIRLPVREFLSSSITHQDEQWVPRHDNIKRALHSTAARLCWWNHHNIRKIISEIHNILLSRNRYRTGRVFWWLTWISELMVLCTVRHHRLQNHFEVGHLVVTGKILANSFLLASIRSLPQQPLLITACLHPHTIIDWLSIRNRWLWRFCVLL